MTPAGLPHPLSPASQDGEQCALGVVSTWRAVVCGTQARPLSPLSLRRASVEGIFNCTLLRGPRDLEVSPGHAVSKWQSPDSNPSSLLSTREIPM